MDITLNDPKVVMSNTDPSGSGVNQYNPNIHWWKIVWFPCEKRNQTIDSIETKLKSIKCDFLKYQIEKCPTTNRLHIDGVMYWKDKKRKQALKNQCAGIHVEIPKSVEACLNYAGKELTRVRGPYEIGHKPHQGERTDIKTNYLEFVGDPVSFIRSHPEIYVKYHKGFEALKKRLLPKRNFYPETCTAISIIEGINICRRNKWSFYVKDGTQWWEGYDQQHAVIISDKKVVDINMLEGCWPYQVPVKGSSVEFRSFMIVYIS